MVKRIIRIIIGVVLMLVLLTISRKMSTRNPEDIVVSHGKLEIRHKTVTEQIGWEKPIVELQLNRFEDCNCRIILRSSESSVLRRSFMHYEGFGRFSFKVPNLDKGKRFEYAFEVTTATKEKIRVPSDPERFFLIKYKGKVSRVVIYLHIIFMFGAFYYMIQSLFSAIGILTGRASKTEAVRMTRWVLICSFIGGWPLGIILNYQAFGVIYEAFPFGYDVTDNKTQLMFLFWLLSALLVRGSFFSSDESRDRLGSRGFAVAVIVSFVVSLALFLIPHSI